MKTPHTNHFGGQTHPVLLCTLGALPKRIACDQSQARASEPLQRRLTRSLFPAIPAQRHHPQGSTPRSLPSPLPSSVQVDPASLPANREARSTDSPPSRSSQGEVNLEARELFSGSRRRQQGLPSLPVSIPFEECETRTGRV